MYIDTVFTPLELVSRGDISDKTVVVIDVLRATTTIAYALSWCSRIIPVETIEEALSLFQTFDKNETLLAGERFCLKPEGFDLGNSPGDFTQDKILGKTIIFSTTNGTRTLKLAQSAKLVTTAAFVNASACASKVFKAKNDVIILCAGRSNKATKEDSACAGLIIELLIEKCVEDNVDFELSDAADISVKYFNYYKDDIAALLESAEAGKNLIEVNLEKDIKDCSLIDTLPIATEYKDGFIRSVK
ncbi:MAG: 2-phosphosulfolactate phosphatase [Candidatus Gastranaerophilales bacterium]|nr:2-phosphosulfolactate phosphatase [Candidatus Gastranaerophilales bacterium]